MHWRSDYEQDLAYIFHQAEQLIAAYPPPFNEMGLKYLHAFNPLHPSSTKNHISYLLPFWMKPVTQLSPMQYRNLSQACIFGMLYFFIQDDLMDTAPADWNKQLALGNLFQLDMLALFRSLFEHSTAFWSYYNAYIVEWSLAVANENSSNQFSLSYVAQKAAPVKLGSTGALILAGLEDLEPTVSKGVELVLTTLQLSDDWADWETDFELHNANTLINMIASEQQEDSYSLIKSKIKNEIYIHDALSRFAKLATANSQSLTSLSLSLPDLEAFQNSLADNLLAAAAELNHNKALLLEGGFTYWLSKNKMDSII